MGEKSMINRKIRLGDLLIEKGYITQEQLESALKKQKELNFTKKLGKIFIDEGYIAQKELLKMLFTMPGQLRQVAGGDKLVTLGAAQAKILAKGNKFTGGYLFTQTAEQAAPQINAPGMGVNGVLGAMCGAFLNNLSRTGVYCGSATVARRQVYRLLGIFHCTVALLKSRFKYLKHMFPIEAILL